MEINKIIQKDCIEGMKGLEGNSIDFIFSDPPYNLIGLDIFMDARIYFSQFKERVQEYKRLLKWDGSMIICGRTPVICELSQIMQENGFICREWIIWHKVDSITAKKDGYSNNYEVFAIFSRNINRKFKHIPVPSKTDNYSKERNIGSIWEHCKISSNHREGCKHPTQKPIKFLKRFVETFTNEGDLILDPFMGSGTTAVAAQELNRKFIGFEVNPEYIKMANKRLEQQNLREI